RGRRGAGTVEPSGDGRRQLQDQSTLEIMECFQGSRLTEETRVAPFRRRPAVLEAAVLHPAQHIDPPCLVALVLVAQALEGDPDLHLVASLYQAASRFEGIVGIQVDVAVEE